MLVAKKKRKENIAEYILYLYQIEDLIRAFDLDMELIEQRLVAAYDADETTKKEITKWYRNLVRMMQKEKKTDSGHLQFLINLINDLNEFHLKLLETNVNEMYTSIYKAVAGLVNELKQKNPSGTNDMEVAIDAIYGYLLLKIQKKSISEETKEAIKRLSQWLGHLSKLYKDYESGDLEF